MKGKHIVGIILCLIILPVIALVLCIHAFPTNSGGVYDYVQSGPPVTNVHGLADDYWDNPELVKIVIDFPEFRLVWVSWPIPFGDWKTVYIARLKHRMTREFCSQLDSLAESHVSCLWNKKNKYRWHFEDFDGSEWYEIEMDKRTRFFKITVSHI